MILSKKIKKNIKRHSLVEYPNECCGIIIDQEPDTLEADNVAPNKKNNFEIDARTYLKALKLGKIVAYYHSHTNENEDFSEADKTISKSHSLPIVMFFLKKNQFSIYKP